MGEITHIDNPSRLRYAVDPLGNLPDISIRLDDGPGYHDRTTSYQIIEREAPTGELTVVRRSFRGTHERYITRLSISDDPPRYHAIGLAAMILVGEEALDAGEEFRTDPVGEYLKSIILWQTLVDRGVARVIDPFLKRPAQRPGRHPEAYRSLLLKGHIVLDPNLTEVTSTD